MGEPGVLFFLLTDLKLQHPRSSKTERTLSLHFCVNKRSFLRFACMQGGHKNEGLKNFGNKAVVYECAHVDLC